MAGTQLNNNFYRPDIDGLRALAVSFVVFYHAFPNVLKCGFIGVDIFFVISGYLIGSIILRHLTVDKFSFLQFYVRRIVRIFPVLLLVLLAVLIAGKFLLLTDEYQTLGKHIAGGAGFVANIIYWSEAGYWDIRSTLKPLLHLWSLGVEEQFYIVIPLILAFAWKRKYHVLAIITVLFILSFSCNLYFYYQKQRELMFYMPFTRFWEIFAGVLLAYHAISSINIVQVIGQKIDFVLCKVLKKDYLESNGKYLKNFLCVIGFILLILSLQICHRHSFPGHRAIWPVLGAVFIISAGSSAWLNKKFLSHKILVGIGLISYPLYLWHWPLLAFCRILNGEYLETNQWILLRIACVFVAIILAFLSYLYIERPIRFGKGNKNKIATILLILIFSIFTLGIYTFYHGITIHKFKSQISYGVMNDNSMLEYAPEANILRYARFKNVHTNKTIALIGDSHAQVGFPGISKKAAELGLNTALFMYRFDSYQDENQRKLVLNVLKTKTDIKYVFIIMRGILYMHGTDYDCEDHRDEFFIKDYKSKLQNLINILRSYAKHVFIVSENPVFPFKPQDFFRFNFTTTFLESWISKESVYEHQREYLQILEELKGVEIINGLDLFCPQNRCSPFDTDGIPLYFDGNHLCVHGSEYLAKNVLEPYLVKIANEK